jgi:N-acetylmuramoyl-L-alanine amidase
MKITDSHWLDVAAQSPIDGGNSMSIRRFLVIHFTAGASAKSSIAWWRKPQARGACAHFVIGRDGAIYQCRPCNRTAGHAGKSEWSDPNTGIRYENLNSCSIGIELANGGDAFPSKFSLLLPVRAKHKHGGPERLWERYPDAQVDACERLAQLLVSHYNLDDVVGHEDIAPSRKTDPGPAFPMARLRRACGIEQGMA